MPCMAISGGGFSGRYFRLLIRRARTLSRRRLAWIEGSDPKGASPPPPWFSMKASCSCGGTAPDRRISFGPSTPDSKPGLANIQRRIRPSNSRLEKRLPIEGRPLPFTQNQFSFQPSLHLVRAKALPAGPRSYCGNPAPPWSSRNEGYATTRVRRAAQRNRIKDARALKWPGASVVPRAIADSAECVLGVSRRNPPAMRLPAKATAELAKIAPSFRFAAIM